MNEHTHARAYTTHPNTHHVLDPQVRHGQAHTGAGAGGGGDPGRDRARRPPPLSAREAAPHTHLDAIFVCVGGGSLLAGVAAAVKQIMPTTKVIGVEPSDYDVLNRSLLSGHRVSLPEPGHFVDGAAVREIGPEVFRVCNELVDDLVTVSNDEICAAVRDWYVGIGARTA